MYNCDCRFYNQHQQLMAEAANKTSAPPPAASAAKRVIIPSSFLGFSILDVLVESQQFSWVKVLGVQYTYSQRC